MASINKKELYELLRADGAKLKAMNFYTVEQLCDTYFDRFGVIYTPNVVEVDKNKKSESENDVTNTDDACKNAHADNTAVDEIRTLVFDRGGWCDELQKSYAVGIYRPSTVEEYAILKQYASKVL